VRRDSAAAVSKASAFIAPSFFVMTTNDSNHQDGAATSVAKTHREFELRHKTDNWSSNKCTAAKIMRCETLRGLPSY
jgi:hypothetical protein